MGDDDFVYSMNHTRRGYFLILSNETFNNTRFENRIGAERDLEALTTTFEIFGFLVIIHKDSTAERMREHVNNFMTEYDHSECDCVGFAVLTHGDLDEGTNENYLVGSDGSAITLEALIEPIKDSQSLYNKPKLIFVQACRGPREDFFTRAVARGQQVFAEIARPARGVFDFFKGLLISSNEQAEPRRNDELLDPPYEVDVLIFYSTSRGYIAWEQPNGSVFIQTLCNVLTNNARAGRSLQSLISTINCNVSRTVIHRLRLWGLEYHRQTPVCSSTLRADVFLTPQKAIPLERPPADDEA